MVKLVELFLDGECLLAARQKVKIYGGNYAGR